MSIELIPALEIPAARGEPAALRPAGRFWQNPVDWEQYQQRVLSAGNYSNHRRVLPGSNFVQLNDWQLPELEKLVQRHLAVGENGQPIPLTESCALFGGFVLVINEVAVLGPQCCGTLADIAGWQEITSQNFISGYFCLEGHPAPYASKHGLELWIVCKDEDEYFDYPALPKIVVEAQALTVAVATATQQLQAFSATLDQLSATFEVAKLSNYLVYATE